MRISPERLTTEAEGNGIPAGGTGEDIPSAWTARLHQQSSVPSRKTGAQGRHCTEPVRVRRAETLGGHRSELRRL